MPDLSLKGVKSQRSLGALDWSVCEAQGLFRIVHCEQLQQVVALGASNQHHLVTHRLASSPPYNDATVYDVWMS